MHSPTITLHGGPVRHCDGLQRRSFLKAGALGFGALTLTDILRGEATAGIRSSNKAIINIHLDGGPPQMDLIDPKPNAPVEIRGEFGSIRTKIPGVHLTELLPRLAAHADKYVFLRSLVGADGKHDAFQCQSGFTDKDLPGVGGRPAMGCVLNKLLEESLASYVIFLDDDVIPHTELVPAYVEAFANHPEVETRTAMTE